MRLLRAATDRRDEAGERTSQPRSDVVRDMPLVSVIIPTRNRSSLLPRALDSVYAQEGIGEQFELEVIVVDDASSDATREVAHRYPGARYIPLSARRGASGARNVGIAASTGTFIAFLDDDDLWLRHRVRVQLAALECHPEAGAVYGQIVFSHSGRAWPEFAKAISGWIFTALLKVNYMAVPSVLIRRQALEKAGYFDESLGSYEDYDLWLRLSFHFPFLFVPGVVAIYNLSPQGSWLRGVASGRGAQDAARAVEKALQLLPESPEYAEMKREARARVALDAVYPLLRLGDFTQAWATVEAALRAHPWVVCYAWSIGIVTQVACGRALDAESPVQAARQMCAQIKALRPGLGIGGRSWVRRVVAGIWAGVARSLALNPWAKARDIVYAAAWALAYGPRYLIRTKLVWFVIRSALGRRADAFRVRWYARLRRTT